jgi:hypothetical protein
MQTMSLQYYEAYIYVKDRRYSINPNKGFKRQLSEWGESIRKAAAAASPMSPEVPAPEGFSRLMGSHSSGPGTGSSTLSPGPGPGLLVTTASGRNLTSSQHRSNDVGPTRKPREGLALTPAIQKLKEGN